MVRLGNFFFHYRNGLFPCALLAALLAAQAESSAQHPALEPKLDVAGAILVLLGQALRIITIGYEYIVRGGRNRQVFATALVQGGMFAHLRNPLYLGNLLIATGFALMVDARAFYLLLLFLGFAYVAIVAAEEAYLRGKFGPEYDRYCSRVNRWWPRWTGWSHSIDGMRFNWRRVVVKEYNTALLVLAALPSLELWSEYRVSGASALPPVQHMVVAVLLWLGLYLFVRRLKKGGYLQAA